MKINKDDYRETISFSEDIPNDNWQLLLDEHNREMEQLQKKVKKRAAANVKKKAKKK
jgi:ATP-dependent RNA helicase RhlE